MTMAKLLGGIMLAIGILIAGASGLCSTVFMVSMIGQSLGTLPLTALPLVLIFGGIPFVVGLGLIFGGRALIRSADRSHDGD